MNVTEKAQFEVRPDFSVLCGEHGLAALRGNRIHALPAAGLTVESVTFTAATATPSGTIVVGGASGEVVVVSPRNLNLHGWEGNNSHALDPSMHRLGR